MEFKIGFHILEFKGLEKRAAIISITWAFMVQCGEYLVAVFTGIIYSLNLPGWLCPLGTFFFQLKILFRAQIPVVSLKSGFLVTEPGISCELVVAKTSPACLKRGGVVLLGIGVSN
jgi:hypothetical protein